MLSLYLMGGFVMLAVGIFSIARVLGWLSRLNDCVACGHHGTLHDPFEGCIAAKVPGLDKPCGCDF